ncbi:MAG: DUF2934 domain-containing protein, partial [Cyanobacteria bacterium P01_G01_bin.54]
MSRFPLSRKNQENNVEIVVLSDQEVRELAYKLWDKDGRPDGKSEFYYHKAKFQLKNSGLQFKSDNNIEKKSKEQEREELQKAIDSWMGFVVTKSSGLTALLIGGLELLAPNLLPILLTTINPLTLVG